MKLKVQYHKGFMNKAAHNLNVIQQNVKYHCNAPVPADTHAQMNLSSAINRVWISWIVDAVHNIVMAIN